MKRTSVLALTLSVVTLIALVGCATTPKAQPKTVEKVSYSELANKSMMQKNDNRLVDVTIQYLGPDVALMPQQALFPDIAKVILVNHAPVGFDYTKKQVSSADSFLVGLPPTKEYQDMVGETLKAGDVLEIQGLTKYVNAGFGTFQHLLLKATSVKVVQS